MNEEPRPHAGLTERDPPMSLWEVEALLADITFAPSCVDMGWQWVVSGAVVEGKQGWTIQCSFRRPDRDTGAVGTGFGRRWYVDAGSSESAIVKTALLAAMQVVEHEMREAFKYRGVRIFDPHLTVAELARGAESRLGGDR